MPRVLLTVEDSFAIEGRGVVLLPKLEPTGDEVFRAGDPIRIRRPDGSDLDTTMHGVEFLTTSKDSFPVILLPKHIDKSDVPIGSEVWSI
jgi:hypothetical protein